jgi:hypothetical protein
MENRNGLVAAAEATLATGTAEREAAERLSRGLPKGATLGADKNYDAEALSRAGAAPPRSFLKTPPVRSCQSPGQT